MLYIEASRFLLFFAYLLRAAGGVMRHRRGAVRHGDVVLPGLEQRHLDHHHAVGVPAPRVGVEVVREGGAPVGDAARGLEQLHVQAVGAHAPGGHQLRRVHHHLRPRRHGGC
eukprot:9359290-Pyramimonas_sp.AAC.2